jgi:hypothetical protein
MRIMGAVAVKFLKENNGQNGDAYRGYRVVGAIEGSE